MITYATIAAKKLRIKKVKENQHKGYGFGPASARVFEIVYLNGPIVQKEIEKHFGKKINGSVLANLTAMGYLMKHPRTRCPINGRQLHTWAATDKIDRMFPLDDDEHKPVLDVKVEVEVEQDRQLDLPAPIKANGKATTPARKAAERMCFHLNLGPSSDSLELMERIINEELG